MAAANGNVVFCGAGFGSAMGDLYRYGRLLGVEKRTACDGFDYGGVFVCSQTGGGLRRGGLLGWILAGYGYQENQEQTASALKVFGCA